MAHCLPLCFLIPKAAQSSTHLSPGQEPWGRSVPKVPALSSSPFPHGTELSRVGPPGLGRTDQSSLSLGGAGGSAIRACRWGARLALCQSHTAQWLSECLPRASPEKESTKGPVSCSQQGPSGWPCRSLLWARPPRSSLYDSYPLWVTFPLLKPEWVTESKILCIRPLLVREHLWF